MEHKVCFVPDNYIFPEYREHLACLKAKYGLLWLVGFPCKSSSVQTCPNKLWINRNGVRPRHVNVSVEAERTTAGKWFLHSWQGAGVSILSRGMWMTAGPNKSQQQGPAQLNLIFANILAYYRPLMKVYVVEQEVLILSSLQASCLLPLCECYCWCYWHIFKWGRRFSDCLKGWPPSAGLHISYSDKSYIIVLSHQTFTLCVGKTQAEWITAKIAETPMLFLHRNVKIS